MTNDTTMKSAQKRDRYTLIANLVILTSIAVFSIAAFGVWQDANVAWQAYKGDRPVESALEKEQLASVQNFIMDHPQSATAAMMSEALSDGEVSVKELGDMRNEANAELLIDWANRLLPDILRHAEKRPNSNLTTVYLKATEDGVVTKQEAVALKEAIDAYERVYGVLIISE